MKKKLIIATAAVFLVGCSPNGDGLINYHDYLDTCKSLHGSIIQSEPSSWGHASWYKCVDSNGKTLLPQVQP